MIRHLATLSAAVFLAAPGWCGEDEPLAASVTTNLVIESKAEEMLGWTRQTLFATEDGRLVDRSGTIVSVAETEAVAVAAAEADGISESAIAAATNATASLTAATNGMAQAGYGIALSIAPETSRPNLTGYVVKETTDGTTDTQWVWYNRSLPLTPIRFVEYSGDTATNMVKAAWVDWSADGETVTHNGRTWDGCHRCTVARPSWAVGERCCTLPNETLGGSGGIDFGDVTITVNGITPFTGYLTNTVNGVVEYYDNGFLKERTAL